MIKQGVLNFVYPELKSMYEWLEIEFNPLKLSSKMEESIQFVEKLSQPEYSQYMSALRDVTVVRLLQQISQVYQTIELKRFIELAPSIDKHRLEKIIVNAAKNKDVQVRIEHKSKALTFGTDLSLSSGQSSSTDTNIIQKMPNEQIRNQLLLISRALYASMGIVNEKANKERNDKLRRDIAQTYARDELIQRKEILKRRELIELYKETKEKELKDRIRRDEIVSRRDRDARDVEEENRRLTERKRREAEVALEREKEEHRFNMKIAIDKLRESEIGRRIIKLIGEDELYTYDPESLNSLHIDAVIKHSREQKEKLKIQYKKVDFLIRAQHEIEVPLINKQTEDDIRLRREIQLAERERAIERRDLLVRMENDKKEFLQSIRGQRHEDFVLQIKEFDQRLNLARQQRLEKLRKEQIEKRIQDFRRGKQLAKQRKEDEKQQKSFEKLKREEEERLALKRAADDKRNKELAEQTRKQRERDEEIERKLQASKSSSSTIRRPAPPPTQEKDKNEGFVYLKFLIFIF
jgi:translation initiation factor 3 subunit A